MPRAAGDQSKKNEGWNYLAHASILLVDLVQPVCQEMSPFSGQFPMKGPFDDLLQSRRHGATEQFPEAW
jgi:hypothetical protein